MNRLSLAAFPTPIWCPEHDEKVDAQKYFGKLYQDISYNEQNDTFLYRGLIFDYFKSGILLDVKRENGETDSYMLVEPANYTQNWLFTYGNQEERW